MKAMCYIFAKPKTFEMVGSIGRWSLRNSPKSIINSKPNVWAKGRDLPDAPKESFNEWYKKRNND
jgi:L-lactate dehydrogenase complex protein LldF